MLDYMDTCPFCDELAVDIHLLLPHQKQMLAVNQAKDEVIELFCRACGEVWLEEENN